MPDLIPKRNTWITVLVCAALIAGVCLFFKSTIPHVAKDPIFVIGLVIGIAGFLFTSFKWLKTLSDPAYEYFSGMIWGVLVFTAFTLAWVGGWSSQYVADKSDTIQADKPIDN